MSEQFFRIQKIINDFAIESLEDVVKEIEELKRKREEGKKNDRFH